MIKQLEIKDPNQVTTDYVPSVDAETLHLTLIGSHVWNMAHEGSDVDCMAMVQEPTTKILDGTVKYQTTSVFKSTTDHGWPIDIHVHEIGRLVPMLQKGNINFFTGLLSPMVRHTTPEMDELKRLVESNPAKNVYNSIHGMAVQNMSRYAGLPRGTFYTAVLERLEKSKLGIPAHRCAKMLTYLEWGMRWLDGSGAVYRPPTSYDHTPTGVVDAIRDLDIAYTDSLLPEEPPQRLLRDWLLKTRLEGL